MITVSTLYTSVIFLLLVPADAGPVPCCSRYGNGTGLIHITALDCLGSEEYIIECKYNAFPITNHEHDVGVMCGQGKLVIIILPVESIK